MKLEYSQKNMMKESEAEIGEPAGKSEERKSRLREFCSKLWDATKRNTATICFAAGAALAVQNCGGETKITGDTKVEEVEEEEKDDGTDYVEQEESKEDQGVEIDSESPGEDITETNDADIWNEIEEEPNENCPQQGLPLNEEVDPLLANTAVSDITLLFPGTGRISGDIETTIGGAVDTTQLLILGECPNERGTFAAFGGQNSSIAVTPQYRVDIGKRSFDASLPGVAGPLCPAPNPDNMPISMYNIEKNFAIKRALVGATEAGVRFEFARELHTKLLVNEIEVVPPILLDGSHLATKIITIAMDEQGTTITGTVYSLFGEERLAADFFGAVQPIQSKTLKIFQLGTSDSILPIINWEIPVGDGPGGAIKVCLTTPDNSPKEVEIEIPGTVIGPVDSCGKVFAAFDLVDLSGTIESVEPHGLDVNYSVPSVVGYGLNTMEDGTARITFTLRREVRIWEPGEGPRILVRLSGKKRSRDKNPKKNEIDEEQITMLIRFYEPSGFDYCEKCGYRLPWIIGYDC
ncbi:MAG: hypothetical protein QXT45_03120 [Candidatus Bilamarchaeaceae archaeon]